MLDKTVRISKLHEKLQNFSPATARLSRLLFTRHTHEQAISAGVEIAASIPHNTGKPTRALELGLGLERMTLTLAEEALPSLKVAASIPDHALREALCNLLLSPYLESASQVFDTPIKLLSSASKTPATHTACSNPVDTLSIQIRNIQDQSRYELMLTSHTDLGSLEHCQASSPIRLDTGLEQIRLPGKIIIREARYHSKLLQSLRTDDILLDCFLSLKADLSEIPDIQIYWGYPQGVHLKANAHIKDNLIRLTDRPFITEHPSSYSGDTVMKNMQDLELPVQLELDSLALSLGQLENMMPGQVLELPVSVSNAQIRIMSYGQNLGTGKLVAVGDNLGLQILHMHISQ